MPTNRVRGSLNMAVSAEELAKRRRAWTPPAPRETRGYAGYIHSACASGRQGR